MELIHSRCAYPDCEKICGCRVGELQEWCYKCEAFYCTLPKQLIYRDGEALNELPEGQEWRMCYACRKS